MAFVRLRVRVQGEADGNPSLDHISHWGITRIVEIDKNTTIYLQGGYMGIAVLWIGYQSEVERGKPSYPVVRLRHGLNLVRS